MNITNGPFAISYSVHPDITNPLLVWAKITVRDPGEQVIAEDGYNRGYSNEETKTITVYQEGIHYLTLEGEFATVDYSLKVGDTAPTPFPRIVIAELKRGTDRSSSPASDYLTTMRVKPKGFSKYCIGISLLYGNIVKHNNFNTILRVLQKMMHKGPIRW